ncbi:MAG: spore germination protein GerW family protein, partial [Myxococcota bacterium]
MQSIQDMMGSLVEHVSDVANSKAVTGEPIQLGDIQVVVLSMLSGGMGAGGGSGHGEPTGRSRKKGTSPGDGTGEGAGGAVKVRPAAVVAFTPNGVQVMPIPGEPGVFDKVVERVPQVVDMVEQARTA